MTVDYDSAGVYFLGVGDFEWRAPVAPAAGKGSGAVEPSETGTGSPRLFVDADACPVKDEVYVVATRYGIPVLLVANTWIAAPAGFGVETVVVDDSPDAADDWIAERLAPGDIVVTGDIPLAARALGAGASAIGHDGRPFDEESIGHALAMRELHAALREEGLESHRPRPLAQKDRSRFLAKLDEVVQRGARNR